MGGDLKVLNKPFGVLALLGEAVPGSGHHNQNRRGLRRIGTLCQSVAFFRKSAILNITRHALDQSRTRNA